MSRTTFNQWAQKLNCHLHHRPTKRNHSRSLAFEHLDQRIVLSATATFIPSVGVLSVFGDSRDNSIVVSRDAAGRILINGGAISVKGGAATVANTKLIQVFGQDGNDQITLDEANGALPA